MINARVSGSTFAFVALAAAVCSSVTAVQAQVTCGAMISTKDVMTTDLTCVVDPGFTVLGGGSVDMAGHQLTACAGCDGVSLTGQGAKLSNGSIVASGATSSGVLLGGTGVHKLENVVVVGANRGFEATSDKNKLKNCAAYAALDTGFRFTGAKNALNRCHASGASVNFYVSGDNNNLTENTSVDASAAGGFTIIGSSNKLSRNTSSSDMGGLSAFYVLGNENKLSLNTVSDGGNNGVYIGGDENKVSKTVSTLSPGTGIVIDGNLNKLSKNAAYDNVSIGISIDGNGNNVNGSNASSNDGEGIRVLAGDANSFKSNVAMGNLGNGLLLDLGVTNSSISKTVALENGNAAIEDLQDDNVACGTNTWSKGIFRDHEAGGVVNHGCIQ
jgi:hypothetical protein